MANYLFGFFFTSNGQGKAGITSTVKIVNAVTGALVVNGDSTTVNASISGLHTYIAIGLADGDYIAVATTPDNTVDFKEIPAMARKQIEVYLDASISGIDTVLTAAHGAGSWQSSSGSGFVEVIYTLTNTVTLLPIEGAEVMATTDLAGNNIVASGVTDTFGNVTFYLDPGTYYIWREKPGFTFTNPESKVVT